MVWELKWVCENAGRRGERLHDAGRREKTSNIISSAAWMMKEGGR